MSSTCSSKYDILSAQIKNKLSLIESITLTSDIWTDTLNTKNLKKEKESERIRKCNT